MRTFLSQSIKLNAGEIWGLAGSALLHAQVPPAPHLAGVHLALGFALGIVLCIVPIIALGTVLGIALGIVSGRAGLCPHCI